MCLFSIVFYLHWKQTKKATLSWIKLCNTEGLLSSLIIIFYSLLYEERFPISKSTCGELKYAASVWRVSTARINVLIVTECLHIELCASPQQKVSGVWCRLFTMFWKMCFQMTLPFWNECSIISFKLAGVQPSVWFVSFLHNMLPYPSPELEHLT